MTDSRKKTIKGGAGYLLSNIIKKGLGFLFILISSRVLGAFEFGVLALGLSVVGVIENIGSLGLPKTIQRYFSGEGEERVNELFGAVLTFAFASAIVLPVFFYVSSDYIANHLFNEPRLTGVFKILSFGIALNILSIILNSLLKAQEKVKQIVISTTSKTFLRIIFLLIAFIWYKNALVAALAGVLATFCTIIYIVRCVWRLDLLPNMPTKEDLKKISSYSVPLIFVGFSYHITKQVDHLMLGWLASSVEVGIYAVVSTLALIMTIFHSSLMSIFLPLTSKAYRNKQFEELNDNYLFISKWVGSINGLVAIFFTGFGFLILGVFGSQYVDETSYQILLILSFLYFFGTWVGPTGAVLQMSDGHRVEFYNTLVFILLNIIMNYFFILSYGLAGAAIGTLIAGIVRNVVQIIEIKYLLGLEVISKSSIPIFFIVLASFIFCSVFEAYRIYIALFFLLILPLYVISQMDFYEKEVIKKVYEKYFST